MCQAGKDARDRRGGGEGRVRSYPKRSLVPLLSRVALLLKRAAKIYLLYLLISSAVSHLLVVDTCRHGTTPVRYLKILLSGGEPSTDREPDSGTSYFYVWRDVRQMNIWDRHKVSLGVGTPFGGPIRYARYNPLAILKFHFRPAEQNREAYWGQPEGEAILDYPDFYSDPLIPHLALRTPKPLSITHLGIFGSLCQGLNGGIFRRIAYHPTRFIAGLLQALVALSLMIKPFPVKRLASLSYVAIWYIAC